MRRGLRSFAVPAVLLLFVATCVWINARKDGGRLIDAEGRRIFVADGDTIRIWGETIRLAGLDAVERAQFCMNKDGSAWSCGQSARLALSEVIAGDKLRCRTIERDHYGRIIARCAGAKGDVGAAMVSQGWAISDGGYQMEENAAREAGRGIWAGTFERPATWRERNRIEPKRAETLR